MTGADRENDAPRLLIRKINDLAEEAGVLATAAGLPVRPRNELLAEAARRGVPRDRMAPLEEILREIERLKRALAEARAAKNRS